MRHPLLRLLPARPLHDALAEFFAPFAAARRLSLHTRSLSEPRADIEVVISPDPAPHAVSVWADGWIVYLNAAAQPGPGDDNTVGAHVAAGLAVAEIFKRLIQDIALRPGLAILPIESLIFSTYDYQLGAGDNPALPGVIDVDGTVMVGLGGIGAAFTAAASSLPALSGMLALVDKDELDDTNLNRELVARPGDVGPKVEICRRALAFHADVLARTEWFADFDEARGERHDLVIVGVDDDRARREIQSSRPRLILNAGTSDVASFRVTRHDYVHGACLSCIARGDLQDHPVERELAHQLGLDLATVLAYQDSGDPLPSALLRTTGRLDEEDIERLGDRPLIDIQQRVCAQVPLGTGAGEEAVSISFLSALPGFLLLGEVIKERAYPAAVRPPLNDRVNHLFMSVFGRPHPNLLHGWRDKREDCDCTWAAYQRAYQRKWL